MSYSQDGIDPEAIRDLLVTVVGGALQAAGYALDHAPAQWISGLYRFRRSLDETMQLIVDVQVLAHPEYPSRLQVTLARAALPGKMPPLGVRKISLPRLVWDVFQVHVLPVSDYWWEFRTQRDLADVLLEAGKLLVGYGLPWLDGSLPEQPASS